MRFSSEKIETEFLPYLIVLNKKKQACFTCVNHITRLINYVTTYLFNVFTFNQLIEQDQFSEKLNNLKTQLTNKIKMDDKFNEATKQRSQGKRIMDAALVTIDLRSFTKQVREEKSWKESDRNAITVFKTDSMRIVLIALQKGAEMIKHTADGMISIQVIEGKIQFSTEEQSVELASGQILTLHENIPHSVLAKEETIFLLTLTTILAGK